MKTRQVTLPPLFSGWDGNTHPPPPGQLGAPPMRAEARAEQSSAGTGCPGRVGCGLWIKQTDKGWWGLSSGWDVSKCSQAPGGLS